MKYNLFTTKRPSVQFQDLSMDKGTEYPLVAVLIINYNGLQDTLECLDSLTFQHYPSIRVVVLDNCSERSELNQIKDHRCKPLCIQSEANLGFARGSNIQIRMALKLGAKYILLLNNDAVVDKEAIGRMVSIAMQNAAGIVGGRIYYYHNRSFLNSIGGRIFWRIGYINDVGMNHRDNSKYDSVSDRDWVSGCAMLIDSQVFLKVGLLDEINFPQGAEDYDFCTRAKQAGFRVLYCPSARVYHKVSRTRHKNKRVYHERHDPKLRLFLKHVRSEPWLITSLFFYLILFKQIEILRYLLKTPDRELKARYLAQFTSRILAYL